MRIRDLLHAKDPTVITVPPELPVRDAMQVLVRHNIGALVVFDGEIRGIITERDLLRAGAEDVQRLATSLVRDLMTAEVITATPEAPIHEVMDAMTEHRIRHLPVTEDGALCGIVSIGDVVNAVRGTAEDENRQLHAYISGRPL